MYKKTIRNARIKLVEQAEEAPVLTNTQKRIFRTLLFEFYNIEDGRCFPFDRTIAKKTGLTERTVRRGKKALISSGWIVCASRHQDKRSQNYRFPKLDVLICLSTKTS